VQHSRRAVRSHTDSDPVRAARTTVERTNGELKDGFLPDTIYKRGAHARYEIALAILLTTMKKVRNVLILYEQHKAHRVS